MNVGSKIKTVNVGNSHAAWIAEQYEKDPEFSFSRLIRQLLDVYVANEDDKHGTNTHGK